MWIEFTVSRDWKPSSQVTIACEKGVQVNYNRDLAQKAIDAGVAKAMKKGAKDAPISEA